MRNPRAGAVVVFIVFIVVLAGVLGPRAAEPADAPEWARELRVLDFGGPAPVDVEVLINDQLATRIGQEVPYVVEIAGLVHEGVNELKLRLLPSETPREAASRLRVAVTPVKGTGRKARVQRPLVEVSIPEGLQLDEACEEVRKFWAGPPAEPDSRLKNHFWLYVHGPPVPYSVAVVIGGVPVADLSAGNVVLDVTPYLRKGRNRVVFEARRSCLDEGQGSEDDLKFDIGIADRASDVVAVTRRPVASFVLNRRRGTKPFSKEVVVRAW